MVSVSSLARNYILYNGLCVYFKQEYMLNITISMQVSNKNIRILTLLLIKFLTIKCVNITEAKD